MPHPKFPFGDVADARKRRVMQALAEEYPCFDPEDDDARSMIEKDASRVLVSLRELDLLPRSDEQLTLLGVDGTVRQVHYGAGRQPLDDIEDQGWGAPFAAGNVLKYLRRPEKDPLRTLNVPDYLRVALVKLVQQWSLDSARFYYARIVTGVKGQRMDTSTLEYGLRVSWVYVYERLNALLTPDEIALLEPSEDRT